MTDTTEEAQRDSAPAVRALLAAKRRATGDPTSDAAPDEWVVVYMDTVTLLLTFFVIMLTFANFERPALSAGDDSRDVKTAAIAIADAFRDNRHSSSLVDRRIQLFNLPEEIEVVHAPRITVIRFADELLFASGSAELRPGGAALLDTLVPPLVVIDRPISVEGHTDRAAPSPGSRFNSNWELSAARANAVVHVLESRGVPSNRLRAVGYGETRPLIDSRTPAKMARNRRVELILREPGAFVVAR